MRRFQVHGRSLVRIVTGMLLSAAMLVTLTGCPKTTGDRANAALPDPEGTATAAMAEYDKNGDGSLSAEEFSASPGLVVASKRLDANADGQISKQEIVDYFTAIEDADLTLKAVSVTVSLDSAPLQGATVTFVPESILGDATKPATGVTDASGRCEPVSEGAKFPAVQLGLYRVKINKDDGSGEQIPAKYNSETELGIDVSTLASEELDKGVVFDLYSR